MTLPLYFEMNEFLGKPLSFWIEIKRALDTFCIETADELEFRLDLIESRECIIFDQAAKQLGGIPKWPGSM